MEPESIKIDATPRARMVLVELKNIAPPPVSNFETLTATPRPGKGHQSEVAVAFSVPKMCCRRRGSSPTVREGSRLFRALPDGRATAPLRASTLATHL